MIGQEVIEGAVCAHGNDRVTKCVILVHAFTGTIAYHFVCVTGIVIGGLHNAAISVFLLRFHPIAIIDVQPGLFDAAAVIAIA